MAMKIMHWDQRYETGLKDVDDQHRSLVELINLFGEQLCQQGEIDWAKVHHVFAELADYAEFHFRDEEQLMATMGLDPNYQAEHKQMHRHFMDEVNHLHAAVSPDKPETASRLYNFLMHWLVSHILGVDQGLVQQIRDIQRGISPAQAYQMAKKHIDPSAGPLLASIQGLLQIVVQRNRELLALNETLEAKVAERTHALREANEQLERMALTDTLTGLPNRRYALMWLDNLWNESIEHNHSLSIMMLDADGFKTINDTYGHDAGDLVLSGLAQTLKEQLRTDDVVCRLGGDEFIVLCPRTPLPDALRVAETLRKTVSALRIQAGDGIWNGSISVGVAERAELPNPEALIKKADDGLYRAKRSGRNCVATIQ